MRYVSKWILAVVLTCGSAGVAATSAWAQSAHTPRKPMGWLGATIQDLSEELTESLPRGVTEGALVNGVLEGSPAMEAGLEEGDVIVKFDQTRVRDSKDLTDAVRGSEPGHVALIEYYRDGGRNTVEVKLEKQKGAAIYPPRGAGRQRARHAPEAGDYEWGPPPPRGYAFLMGDTPRLGVQLVDLTDQLSKHFGVESGVMISEVTEGSAAETAGLAAGDIIVAVGGKTTENSEDVRDELGKVDVGNVDISVMRDGKKQDFTAELKKPRKARMSGYGPTETPMFNVPMMEWNQQDQEQLKAQMKALQEQMEQLREQMSEMGKDSR